MTLRPTLVPGHANFANYLVFSILIGLNRRWECRYVNLLQILTEVVNGTDHVKKFPA